MRLWQTPITDRTRDDVNLVKNLSLKRWEDLTDEQKQMWLNGLKGALNKSDLERIENNIHILADVFQVNMQTFEDNIPTIPTPSYWQNLIDNVIYIRKRGYAYWNTPETPLMPLNQYQKINDIEMILRDTYTILLTNLYYESIDDWHTGEEVGLVL